MEKTLNLFKIFVSAIGTGITYLIGDWDTALIVLAIFVAMDYITGVLVAWINNTLNSEVGYKGLAKKALILVILVVAVCLDRLLGNTGWVFRTLVCYFYIANEGISILENAGNLGLPIPTKLRNALEQLEDKEEVNDQE